MVGIGGEKKGSSDADGGGGEEGENENIFANLAADMAAINSSYTNTTATVGDKS